MKIVTTGLIIILIASVCTAQTPKTHEVVTAETKLTEGIDSTEIKDVVIVYKTHFDIGFTDSAKNVVHTYHTKFIDKALRVLEKSRDLPEEQQFIWTVPGWPMERMVENWDGQSEERREKLIRAFREGRFVAHALAFTTHTESMEAEELVRSLEPSVRIARLGNRELPIAGKLSDVPSHSWIIPTLLKHAGIKFLHIGCNDASAHPEVPSLFWWEGPDGSRVLTMYSHWYYSHQMQKPNDWTLKSWLALMMTGDNQGPPKPDQVAENIVLAEQTYPNARIRTGTMDDFARLILKEDLSEIPVIRGDMPDTWIHGIMASPHATRSARRNRPRIPGAEGLNVMMGVWGLDPVEMNAAVIYERSIRFGEHTWGHVSQQARKQFGEAWRTARESGQFDFYESTWDEKSECAFSAEAQLNKWVSANMNKLAQGVAQDGSRVVVFNSLGVDRDGIVEVESPLKKGVALKNVKTGITAPVEATATGFRFLASSVPAGGYNTYIWDKNTPAFKSDLRVDRDKCIIENAFYQVKFTPECSAVTSITDKRSGRELIDNTSKYGFGQYLYERFSRSEVLSYNKAYSRGKGKYATRYHPLINLPHMPQTDEVPYWAAIFAQADLDFVMTDLSVSVEMKATDQEKLGHDITTTVTLYANQPYIDLTWSIKDKPAEVLPEAGWICFPLKATSPAFRLGRLGSIIDLEKDTVKGTNRDILCLENAVAVTDGKAATCVLPLDSPLISLERPGIWKYTPDFIPQKPVVFINLYNNQWNTNFRLWNEGTWTSSVRLWSTDDYDDGGDLFAPSLASRVPLEAAMVDAPVGPLPISQGGIKVSHANVRLSALVKNHNGEGILLRLWEQGGNNTTFMLEFPKAMKVTSLQPCNLRGEPWGQTIKVKNNKLQLTINGFSPLSFLTD